MACATTFKRRIAFVLVVIACGTVRTSTSAQRGPTNYTVHTLPLPDNGKGDVSMDYIAFDPATNSLWVPGGNTGAAEVPARGAPAFSGPLVSASVTKSCTLAIVAAQRYVRSTRARWRVSLASILTSGRTESPTSRRTRRSG
jgi:hypothetical protein